MSRGGRQSEIWSLVGFYTGLGFILPASTVAGYLLGWYLDRWLGTKPVLAVALGLAGTVGGFVEILTLMKREEKRAAGDNSLK